MSEETLIMDQLRLGPWRTHGWIGRGVIPDTRQIETRYHPHVAGTTFDLHGIPWAVWEPIESSSVGNKMPFVLFDFNRRVPASVGVRMQHCLLCRVRTGKFPKSRDDLWAEAKYNTDAAFLHITRYSFYNRLHILVRFSVFRFQTEVFFLLREITKNLTTA